MGSFFVKEIRYHSLILEIFWFTVPHKAYGPPRKA